MDNITVEIEIPNDKEGYPSAHQAYTLNRVLSKIIGRGDHLIEVYQSDNFFGHPVTLGVMVTNHGNCMDDGYITLEFRSRATVCSENDTFDPAHGIEIVTGRLLLSEEGENDAIVTKKKTKVEDSRELINLTVQQSARRLCDYLLERDSAMHYLELEQSVVRSSLQEQFAEFK